MGSTSQLLDKNQILEIAGLACDLKKISVDLYDKIEITESKLAGLQSDLFYTLTESEDYVQGLKTQIEEKNESSNKLSNKISENKTSLLSLIENIDTNIGDICNIIELDSDIKNRIKALKKLTIDSTSNEFDNASYEIADIIEAIRSKLEQNEHIKNPEEQKGIFSSIIRFYRQHSTKKQLDPKIEELKNQSEVFFDLSKQLAINETSKTILNEDIRDLKREYQEKSQESSHSEYNNRKMSEEIEVLEQRLTKLNNLFEITETDISSLLNLLETNLEIEFEDTDNFDDKLGRISSSAQQRIDRQENLNIEEKVEEIESHLNHQRAYLETDIATLVPSKKDDVYRDIESRSSNPLSKEEFVKKIRTPNVLSKYAFHNNKIAGYLAYEKNGNTIRILKLEIASNKQRKGIGSCFINELKESLASGNVNQIIVEVANDNINALNFFKKNGFYAKKNGEVFIMSFPDS